MFQLFMLVLILVFPFVKDLKTECSVAESLSEFLPGNFLTDIFKDARGEFSGSFLDFASDHE